MRPAFALVAAFAVGCNSPHAGSAAKPTASATVAVAPTEIDASGGIEDGDIVFQTSQSAQSQAIQLATHSRFSHVGIVYRESGGSFVFEAIGPVTTTPLVAWIARGEGGHYTVKRVADRSKLGPDALRAMRTVGKRYAGKPYDFTFEWSNDRIYCSELVWKVFHEGAGIDLAPLQKLGDFDLSSPTVKAAMAQRFGAKVPLDETVISPQNIADSSLLMTVLEK
jgi:hypothetical protein